MIDLENVKHCARTLLIRVYTHVEHRVYQHVEHYAQVYAWVGFVSVLTVISWCMGALVALMV